MLWSCEYTATVTTMHKRVKLKNSSPKNLLVYCWPQSTNRQPTVSQQVINSGPTNDQKLFFNFTLKKEYAILYSLMFLSVYKVFFSTEFSQMVSCCDFLHQKENATSTKDWIWDKEELESAFTEKTRAIVINTPHNPIGKVKIHIVYSFIYMIIGA